MPSRFKLDVPDGLGELVESFAHAVIQRLSARKFTPDDQWIFQTASEHFKAMLDIRNQAQSGLSPSSTEEYANKAPIIVQAGERKASEGGISADRPPEEPESNDTSYGVEATAIRTLAASTGTVAILGTTAKTSKDSNSTNEESDDPSTVVVEEINSKASDQVNREALTEEKDDIEKGRDEKNDEVKDAIEEKEVEDEKIGSAAEKVNEGAEEKDKAEGKDTGIVKESVETTTKNVFDEVISSEEKDEGVEIVEELNKIVYAESAQSNSLGEESPSNAEMDKFSEMTENASSISKCKVPKTLDLKASISDANLIAVESKATEKGAVDESEKQELEIDVSAHSRTLEEDDNDISSEQLKTNSLSDVSISELEETPRSVVKTEIPSESSLPLPQDIKSSRDCDGIVETQPLRLVQSTSNDDEDKGDRPDVVDKLTPRSTVEAKSDIEDNARILNLAATTIQSNFRGYQTRKNMKTECDESVWLDSPKLTDSLMETVKAEVDCIIKEAEVKTESLINSPMTDEFPAPPEDMLLDARKSDEDSVAVTETITAVVNAVSSDFHEEMSNKKMENSTAELARMTADEDLPAPDFELLESSSTDDINTEIINNSLKGTDDELRDSTEGDLTLDENSERAKEPSKCDYSELKHSPSAVSDVQPENTPSQDTTSSLLSQDLLEDDNLREAGGRHENNLNSNESQSRDASNGESLRTISTESPVRFENSNNTYDATSANSSEAHVNDSNPSGEDLALDSLSHLKEDPASDAVEIAATKIQAHVRGYLARKLIDNENKTDSAGEVDTVVEMNEQPQVKLNESTEIDKNEDDTTQTASEIKTNGPESETIDNRNKRKSDNGKTEEDNEEPVVDEKLINTSAAKIQAGVRGFLVRKRQKTLKECPQEKNEETTVNN